MVKSRVFDRLDLSAEFYEQFICRNEDLRKWVGFFEIESIDKPNVITIEWKPKEYYERFIDHSDKKKHKGLTKSALGMDFDSYSTWLFDLTEYLNEFLIKPNKVEQIDQKRFQVIKFQAMQMKSVSKVQFGQLNDKTFLLSKWNNIFAIWSPLFRKVKKRKT